MVIDYSSQRPVSKNRPRKQPAAVFVVALLVTAGVAFLLGVGTGWLMFGGGRKNNGASVSAGQKSTETPPPNQTQPPAGTAVKPAEPSLTFYETLPKGNRELMGSGLNLPKQADQPQLKTPPKPKPPVTAKPAAPEESQAQSKEVLKTPAKSPELAPAREAAAKEGEGKVKYAVQVASYHVKKEAEEARDRLKAEGMAAYVVEINIPEKGTYYRVRIGRHMDQQSARELAEKAGQGSILIPE